MIPIIENIKDKKRIFMSQEQAIRAKADENAWQGLTEQDFLNVKIGQTVLTISKMGDSIIHRKKEAIDIFGNKILIGNDIYYRSTSLLGIRITSVNDQQSGVFWPINDEIEAIYSLALELEVMHVRIDNMISSFQNLAIADIMKLTQEEVIQLEDLLIKCLTDD